MTKERKDSTGGAGAEIFELLRRSRGLPQPADYWSGSPEGPPICPENLLLFSRHDAANLMGPSPNQHHRHVLIVNLKGRGKVAVETRIHPLGEAEALLVFPFQSHCYVEISPPAIEWLFISFEHRPDARLDVLRDRGAVRIRRSGRNHLRNLLRGWASRNSRETLPLHLGLWLHEMAESQKSNVAVREMRVADSEAALVENVNRMVFARRDHSWPIGELSAALGISGSALRSRFRMATGRSIGRHVREMRLNFACELLYGTRLRMEEIAARCGYETLFAFSRAFRNAQGCSPSQYRKRRIAPNGS